MRSIEGDGRGDRRRVQHALPLPPHTQMLIVAAVVCWSRGVPIHRRCADEQACFGSLEPVSDAHSRLRARTADQVSIDDSAPDLQVPQSARSFRPARASVSGRARLNIGKHRPAGMESQLLRCYGFAMIDFGLCGRDWDCIFIRRCAVGARAGESHGVPNVVALRFGQHSGLRSPERIRSRPLATP